MSPRRGQHGFTLIELLVAMAAGMVVIGGAVTVMLSTLTQTQVQSDRVAANRATRLALSNIENELHSACVGTGSNQNLAPIQPGSNASQLTFVSFSGTAIDPTPVWHVLSFNANVGTLTDASYAVTGTPGSWTPARSPTSTATVLAHVSTANSQPVFQYFAYKSYPDPGNTDLYWAIPDGVGTLPDGTAVGDSAEAFPLTSGATGSAAATVEVVITLEGYGDSASGVGNQAVGDPESDAVSLRVTDPPAEAPASASGSFGPCE